MVNDNCLCYFVNLFEISLNQTKSVCGGGAAKANNLDGNFRYFFETVWVLCTFLGKARSLFSNSSQI